MMLNVLMKTRRFKYVFFATIPNNVGCDIMYVFMTIMMTARRERGIEKKVLLLVVVGVRVVESFLWLLLVKDGKK